jgi:hypothetical protein
LYFLGERAVSLTLRCYPEPVDFTPKKSLAPAAPVLCFSGLPFYKVFICQAFVLPISTSAVSGASSINTSVASSNIVQMQDGFHNQYHDDNERQREYQPGEQIDVDIPPAKIPFPIALALYAESGGQCAAKNLPKARFFDGILAVIHDSPSCVETSALKPLITAICRLQTLFECSRAPLLARGFTRWVLV